MKSKMLAKYQAATKLRKFSDVADWLRVFPDRGAMLTFEKETGWICFPEFYGQSPWDDAYSIAYQVKNGISGPSSIWLERQLASDSKNNRKDAMDELFLLFAYSVTLPESTVTAFMKAIAEEPAAAAA